MRSNRDVAGGWLRKAESDLANAPLCLDARQALDTACFHCQQAAQKALKAYLTAHAIPFPFIHDLGRLVKVCAEHSVSSRGPPVSTGCLVRERSLALSNFRP